MKLWSINRDKVCGGVRVAVRGNGEGVRGVLRAKGIEGWVEVETTE